MDYRIGIGYDVHRLVKGKKIILGGVEIPFKKGLLAYSDGDVLSHAICDALLGAAGLGDIGIHFPNTDKRYKGISSLKLLSEVLRKLSALKYRINNIDSVLIADSPKIGSYRNKIIASLSKVLEISSARINLKATTSEGVGDIGSRGLAVYAVALLVK